MKYVKVSDLLEELTLVQTGLVRAQYDSEEDTLYVDFSEGIPRAVITSYQEVGHKILNVLHIDDHVVRMMESFLRETTYTTTRHLFWIRVRAVFSKPEYSYVHIEEDECIEED